MNSTDIQASLSNILDRLGNLLTDGEKDALYEVIDGVQDGLFDDRFWHIVNLDSTLFKSSSGQEGAVFLLSWLLHNLMRAVVIACKVTRDNDKD